MSKHCQEQSQFKVQYISKDSYCCKRKKRRRKKGVQAVIRQKGVIPVGTCTIVFSFRFEGREGKGGGDKQSRIAGI
jgi:hypothetical protein